MVSLLAQFPLAKQDMVATEYMIQGSGHAEDAFYQTVWYVISLYGHVAQFVDLSELELEEAVDIGTWHHVDMSSME